MNPVDVPSRPTAAPIAFTPANAAQYRRALQQAPEDFGAWYGLASLDDTVFYAAETRELERLHGLDSLDSTARIIVGFALAHALEDQGRHAEAFAILGVANSMRRRGLRWDATGFSRTIDATVQAFANPPSDAVTHQGGSAIFLVGMPCAGADLVERILRAHPDVESSSARGDFGAAIEEVTRDTKPTFATWASTAGASDWQQLGERHEQRTAAWRDNPMHFVDGALSNWRFAGAIAAALPAAHIIEVVRDPLETCFGCYRCLFANGQFFSYDIDELIACWRDYERLMRFWSERHPRRIHRFSHERLVADPTTEIAGLLAHCGLRFDDACLAAMPAIASAPTMAARVAGYGGLLMPLRLALGMAPA